MPDSHGIALEIKYVQLIFSFCVLKKVERIKTEFSFVNDKSHPYYKTESEKCLCCEINLLESQKTAAAVMTCVIHRLFSFPFHGSCLFPKDGLWS